MSELVPEEAPEQGAKKKKLSQRHWFALVVFVAAVGLGYLFLVKNNPAPAPMRTESTGSGSLLLETDPTGALVEVDGEETEYRTPVRIDGLSSGKHEVRVTLSGYRSVEETVQIRARQTTSIDLRLTK